MSPTRREETAPNKKREAMVQQCIDILWYRYTVFPRTLFRIQPRLPVAASQPLSLPLWPVSPKMVAVLADFPADSPQLRVFRMQEATAVPEGFCVFHDHKHSDHYSLQAAREMPLAEMNARLTAYLESLPPQTRDKFIEWYNDPDDQNN
ncbi:hypothetical protein BDR26DRAFT_1004909 [Obelidium mucronatum]|nr:hypothetical protein BDR26DRAFT_1004909 [Obelidium mucronatum]